MKKSRGRRWLVAVAMVGAVAVAVYAVVHASSRSGVTISSYEEVDTTYNSVVEVVDSGRHVAPAKKKKGKKKVAETPPRDILSEDVPCGQ